MKAVIVAGGRGTRFAEETHLRPKPMIEVGGRPILWHIMKTYAHYGINEFVVCMGYKAEYIKEYFTNYHLLTSDVRIDLATGTLELFNSRAEDWKITLIDTGVDTMTGGRLRRVADYLDPEEDFCFTYGDGVGDIDIGALVAFHKSHGAEATVTAAIPPGRFGNMKLEGVNVESFREKNAADSGHVNAGFFVLKPSVLKRLSGDSCVWEEEPLTELAEQGQLKAFMHNGFWQPMDTLRDKILLDELTESGSAPWMVWRRQAAEPRD